MNHNHTSATDWRTQIRKNQHRTHWVIFIFFMIYLGLGLLIDTMLYAEHSYVPISTIFYALITLKLFPIATLITLAVAAFSLLVSRWFSDRIMLLGTDYKQITPDTATSLVEKQLYNVVEEMKVAAGLRFMPRVYIIDANYMNAFASGLSEKSAMVAITRGLLEKLDRSELQAVMAHELSHIRHEDIRLTMTASVLSNMILIVIDILFYNMIYGGERKREDNRFFIIVLILRFVMPIITILLMLYLSRTREYMADSGCVELMRDNTPLGRALIKIHQDHQTNINEYRQEYGQTAHEDVRRAAYLYDPVSTGADPVKSISSMFSTHPNLEQRLRAIGFHKE